MNVALFWDVDPCGPYVNRSFGGTFHLNLQSRKLAEKEVGGDAFLRNVGSNTSYTMLYPRRWYLSSSIIS
jgi:hypothetical protein